MQCTEVTIAGQHILYDAEVITKISPQWFEAEYWVSVGGLTGKANGRGEAFFFKSDDREFVLRHYQRGGMIGPLLGDRYLWVGLKQSRAWREWHLLANLAAQQLPVPSPVAARVCNNGMMYTADLITRKIRNSITLSNQLSKSALDGGYWRLIGKTIRRFHDVGADHSDLNAHNVLLSDNKVYLIDFDKSSLRKPSEGWQQSNLQRLQRSLMKLAGRDRQNMFFYNSADWQALLEGYRFA